MSEFHRRWGIDREREVAPLPTEWLLSRSALIAEENAEFAAAGSWEDVAEEAADVLFVAIGTLDMLPDGLAVRAIRTVIDKNDAKTDATHFIHPTTGKVTRRTT